MNGKLLVFQFVTLKKERGDFVFLVREQSLNIVTMGKGVVVS
jgi:hypothetical protein